MAGPTLRSTWSGSNCVVGCESIEALTPVHTYPLLALFSDSGKHPCAGFNAHATLAAVHHWRDSCHPRDLSGGASIVCGLPWTCDGKTESHMDSLPFAAFCSFLWYIGDSSQLATKLTRSGSPLRSGLSLGKNQAVNLARSGFYSGPWESRDTRGHVLSDGKQSCLRERFGRTSLRPNRWGSNRILCGLFEKTKVDL